MTWALFHVKSQNPSKEHPPLSLFDSLTKVLYQWAFFCCHQWFVITPARYLDIHCSKLFRIFIAMILWSPSYFSCLMKVITASPKCCNHKYFSCLMKVITASSKPCNKDSEQIWAVHIQILSWWDTFIVAADLSPCPCSWIHSDSVSSEVLVIALTSIKLICSQRCWLKFCWLQVNVTIGLLRIIISSGNAFIMSCVNPKRAFIEQLKYNPCWEFV